ncbi:hypothetical protein KO02_12230 [Sphingobacterium sp. ML3W]|uniref:hypothetical protein n=1 Tax=Sphingobacterium sp. ML3W TaxID=1538644 RepID=UPI0004F8EDB3|nr:hypothetical protein [Sphingobacterium sp. ML3W]AIM37373.1 hypothetical protein KO02_12230 [Sphingobacterium sp. ML3W]
MSYVMAGATILSVGTKIGSGISQKNQANKLAAANKLASYEVPGEVKNATNIAERQYLNGLPGLESAKADIDRGGANAYAKASEASTSSNDLLDSIAKIQESQNNAYNDLGTQSMGLKMKAADAYQEALLRQAQFEDKKYQMNEYDPYMRKANAAASIYGAGQTNISSGLDGFANIAMGLSTQLANKKALDAFGNTGFTVKPSTVMGVSSKPLNEMKSSGVTANTSLNSATEAAASLLRNYKF